MDYQSFLVRLGKILESLKKDYFVTGGFAVSVWGRPRSTFDVDIVIALKESDISVFAKAMRTLGEGVYVDEEMMKSEIQRGGEFNIVDPNSGLKVDFFVMKDDQFTRMQNIRKRPTTIDQQVIYFVSPEDLILSKLVWAKKSGSERQLRDVESVCDMMGHELNWDYVREWAKKLDLEALLRSIEHKNKK